MKEKKMDVSERNDWGKSLLIKKSIVTTCNVESRVETVRRIQRGKVIHLADEKKLIEIVTKKQEKSESYF